MLDFNLMCDSHLNLKGRLLIASPKLNDPNFFRSVVLIVQHDESGTLGLVLNRPLETTIPSAWKKVSDTPCRLSGPLHSGGPCEGVLMAVHDDLEASDIEVMDGVHFSSSKEAVEHIVAHSHRARLFVGYAGWSIGQLEDEIDEGGWQVIQAPPECVFDPARYSWQALRWQLSQAALLRWMPEALIPRDPSMN